MAISLDKGQKVDITKGNPGLTNLLVGLGWDKKVEAISGSDFDLDAHAFMVNAEGKVEQKGDYVFYKNLQDSSGAVKHTGDNLTGEGAGDDEQILVDLSKVPARIQRIIFAIIIYMAEQRKQTFGQVNNAFVRVADSTNPRAGSELCRFDLTEDYSTATVLLAGELYRHGSDWKFNALGQSLASYKDAYRLYGADAFYNV